LKKQIVIPIQPDGRSHLFWFVSVQDLFLLLPFAAVGYVTFKFLGIIPIDYFNDPLVKFGFSILPLPVWGYLILYSPIRHRKNIKAQQFLFESYSFIKREKSFEFTKDIDNVNRRKIQKESTQSRIPIKKIAHETYETKDNALVAVLKVDTINLSLENDENETRILDNYEKRMLVNLDFDIQQQIVAEKIDLREHRNQQINELEAIEDPIQRRLKESYIDYVKEKENNNNLVKKQRYVVIREEFSPNVQGSKQKAREELKHKVERVQNLLENIPVKSKLSSTLCTNEGLKHSLRLFLDYEYSFIENSVSDEFSEFVVGRKSLREGLKEVMREDDLQN